MSDFSATALLEVKVDKNSIKSAKSEIEDSLNHSTVDVSGSSVAASNAGAAGGSGGRNPRHQLLDQSNTHLNTATDQLDDVTQLAETRNDLLREMLDVQEARAQDGGNNTIRNAALGAAALSPAAVTTTLAVGALASAANSLMNVIPDGPILPDASSVSDLVTSVSASDVLTSVSAPAVLTAAAVTKVLNAKAVTNVLNAKAVTDVLNAKNVTNVLNAAAASKVLNAVKASTVLKTVGATAILSSVAASAVLSSVSVAKVLTSVSLSELVNPVPASELTADTTGSGADSGQAARLLDGSTEPAETDQGSDSGTNLPGPAELIAATASGGIAGALSKGGLGNIGSIGSKAAGFNPAALLTASFASEALTDRDIPNNLVTQSPGIPDPSPSGPVTDYLTSPYSALQELGAPELDDASSPYSDAPGNGGADVTINNTTRVENNRDERDVERIVDDKLREWERDLKNELGDI